MKNITLNNLLQTDYNIFNLFAMNQHWDNNYILDIQQKNGRSTSALLYINNCSAEYILPEKKSFIAKQGDILYIPQGSNYKTIFHDTSTEKISTMLIEFTTLDKDLTPFVFYPDITIIKDNQSTYKHYFTEIISLYMSPVQPISIIKSIMYKFLSELCNTDRIKNIYSKEFRNIADGILYLENDTTYEKSLQEIAAMCHVSSSYFRKLFKKYSGVSPLKYQINVKITHAKLLLQNTSMTISEISDRLGFSDSSYFCKCFKKQTGITPRQYIVLKKF